MKVKIRAVRNLNIQDLCKFESNTLSDLTSKLGQLKFPAKPSKSADIFSEWFSEISQELNMIQEFRISNDIPLERAYANYRMDAVLDEYSSECGHNHRINVQLFLDNRQAIGTNLLKFEISSNRFEKTEDDKSFAIAISIDKECKKALKIDNSVATYAEYEKACNNAYDGILKCRLAFICLTS